MPGTILVVDDEKNIVQLARLYLNNEGYRVEAAHDGKQALEKARALKPDLIVLDIMMPEMDGLTVCKELRKTSNVPVIILTARGDDVDRIVGLELGADDYLAKPFELRELLARIRAVLRRTSRDEQPASSGHRYTFDGWTFDVGRRSLTHASGGAQELTTSEFNLLAAFVKRPHRALSRDEIMDLLKGHDWSPLDRSIDNLIARLRKKIEHDPNHPGLIKTVRGVGYAFTADVKRHGPPDR
jgi:DNA-binding response OmpR family regulator